MLWALLLSAATAAAAPAWHAELGLSERAGALVYTRHQPRTGAAAESVLTSSERETVEGALAKIPDENWESACAALVENYCRGEKIDPEQTIWFENAALTAAGKEAVAGVLLGDAIGMRFVYPDDERLKDYSLGPRISLDRARLQLPADFSDGAKTEETAPAVDAGGALPPLPPRAYEPVSQLTFDLAKRPYTMDATRSQWERWQARAEAWKNDAFLRELYGGDSNKFWGAPGNGEIMALIDPVVTAVDQSFPNPVTRLLTRGAKAYEDLLEKVPIRARDDFWDYLARLRAHPEEAGDPERFKEATGLVPPVQKIREIPLKDSEDPLWRQAWDALHPGVSFRLNPRLDDKAPSAAFGGRLSMEYAERIRIKVGCDYDTKGRQAQGYGALSCDW